MEVTTSRHQSRVLPSGSWLMLGFILFFGLVGCGGGGGDPAIPDPKGYYDPGSASVMVTGDTGPLSFTDLHGMVSGNRFMLISASEVLLYDGTITGITDNTYTATVKIYRDGVLIPTAEGTANVTGTFTAGSSMLGSMDGTGAGNGTFSLTYSVNNSPSALSRIAKDWRGPMNGLVDGIKTIISNAGALSREAGIGYSLGTPALGGCNFDAGSTVLPISGVNIYDVTINLISCTNPVIDGAHTGFATTQTIDNLTLNIAFSNGNFSGSGALLFDP